MGMGLGTHSWGHGGTTTVTPSLFAMVQICLSFSGTSGLNAQLLSLSSPAEGEVRPVHQLLQAQVGRLPPFEDGPHDARREEGQGQTMCDGRARSLTD